MPNVQSESQENAEKEVLYQALLQEEERLKNKSQSLPWFLRWIWKGFYKSKADSVHSAVEQLSDKSNESIIYELDNKKSPLYLKFNAHTNGFINFSVLFNPFRFERKTESIRNLRAAINIYQDAVLASTANPLSVLLSENSADVSSVTQTKSTTGTLSSKEIFNPNDPFGNTSLTSMLSSCIFDHSKDSYERTGKSAILKELESIISNASHDSNKENEALTLLRTPNASPYMRNTPLMLLVKGGDIDACRLLLPFYDAKALLETTPRGNTVYHIAAASGQIELLKLIKSRAIELNVFKTLDEYQNTQNYTAKSLVAEVTEILKEKKTLFCNCTDVINPKLGGEEMNKTTLELSKKKMFELELPKVMAFFQTDEGRIKHGAALMTEISSIPLTFKGAI